jgi:hypothetical protein
VFVHHGAVVGWVACPRTNSVLTRFLCPNKESATALSQLPRRVTHSSQHRHRVKTGPATREKKSPPSSCLGRSVISAGTSRSYVMRRGIHRSSDGCGIIRTNGAVADCYVEMNWPFFDTRRTVIQHDRSRSGWHISISCWHCPWVLSNKDNN